VTVSYDYTFHSFTNIIDVYVNYLRKKVDRDYPTKLIHMERGKWLHPSGMLGLKESTWLLFFFPLNYKTAD
jgi:hypothetical protein